MITLYFTMIYVYFGVWKDMQNGLFWPKPLHWEYHLYQHNSRQPVSFIVYPRNLVEKVIAHSAAGVILVHNHPGGKTDPSREDIALTKKLIKLGEDMDFRILDHFIVTENEIISLKAIGLLDK